MPHDYIVRMKWPLMILVGMLGVCTAGAPATAAVLAAIHILTWNGVRLDA